MHLAEFISILVLVDCMENVNGKPDMTKSVVLCSLQMTQQPTVVVKKQVGRVALWILWRKDCGDKGLPMQE